MSVGAALPALTWTGLGTGEVSVIGAGWGGDPLANGEILLIVKWVAILGCVVVLGTCLKGRVGITFLAGSVAFIAAVAWAALVPANVASVHEVGFLTIDFGAVTVHPWIWAPAIGQFAVLLGVWLWAIGGRSGTGRDPR